MNVGIIGSGSVGRALTAGFVRHGHSVMVASRDTAKLEQWRESIGSGYRTGDIADTAAFGELLVLAVKGSAAEEALALATPGSLAGKTILDATNPIADSPPTNGVLHFFTTLEESLMERLQRRFSDAHFVKAFSCVGAHLMVNPSLESMPSMFICGNDDAAKAEARGILAQFGWEVEDMGAAEAARAIEPLCILWCIPGFREQRWGHAFKLLKG